VCLSRETYIELPVEKYELDRDPGDSLDARIIACLIASLFVASPLVWNTTTFGGRIPVWKVRNVRWSDSYADLPGIEKLWNQRFDTWPAAKPPKRVRTIQAPITYQRLRAIRCARRASIKLLPSGSAVKHTVAERLRSQ